MSEWKEIFIDSACSRLSSGKSISSSLIKDKGDYPVYGGNGIRGFTNTYNFDGECAIIGRQGASCGNVRYFSGKAYMTEHAVVAVPTKEHNAYYLSCVLASLKLGRLSGQSAQPGIGVGLIGKQNIIMPSLTTQQKIASILSSLDSKIENNRKICANLEAQAQALFKHWFIDFAPFKEGKFVESELGMIPEGWRVGSILDIAELYDYQRKPLSSMEREDMKGDYPYYGATSIMDYIDKYIFDGTYVLMGEDGSVVKDNGCPYLQYVWGKFWPNNHAHVMQGKNGFSTEMLYCFLSITDVRSIVTGAVQMKISQRSMSHLLTVIPPKSVCGDYNRIIRPLFDLIKSTKEENARLSSLRDTLLPKLMSGAIKV